MNIMIHQRPKDLILAIGGDVATSERLKGQIRDGEFGFPGNDNDIHLLLANTDLLGVRTFLSQSDILNFAGMSQSEIDIEKRSCAIACAGAYEIAKKLWAT